MSFGGVQANADIGFTVAQGETVGLIGPNGAGKTTLFNCITGFLKPDAGRIAFQGRDITGKPPHVVNRLGVARTFQVMESGGDMTILEEVMTGAFCRTRRRGDAKKEAEGLIEIFGLEEAVRKKIFELPAAMQKRVGIARALATRPALLMLDEAAAGLTPSEIGALKTLIRKQRRKTGLTLLIIEHVMDLVMDLSDRIIVLDGGRKICDGPPDAAVADETVIRAYLGKNYADRRCG